MQDMRNTIIEYKTTCNTLRERIDKLTEEINKNPGNAAKELLDRRHFLYGELGELQYGIYRMEEYIQEVG